MKKFIRPAIWSVVILVVNLVLLYLVGKLVFNMSPGQLIWLKIVCVFSLLVVAMIAWYRFFCSFPPATSEDDDARLAMSVVSWVVNFVVLVIVVVVLRFGFVSTNFYMHYWFSSTKVDLPIKYSLPKKVKALMCYENFRSSKVFALGGGLRDVEEGGCEVLLQNGSVYEYDAPFNLDDFLLYRVNDKKVVFVPSVCKGAVWSQSYMKDALPRPLWLLKPGLKALESWPREFR